MNISDEIQSLFDAYAKIQNTCEELGIYQEPPDAEGRTTTLIVTDECNLRCTYCYLTDKKSNIMSWEVAKEFIDYKFESKMYLKDIPIEEQTQFDHSQIWDFIGGEPFLEYELVFKSMDYITEKTMQLPLTHPWKRGFTCKVCEKPHWTAGYRFSFSTNGTLLTNPELRKNLEKYEKVTSLGVTIDGPKEMHDSCRVYADSNKGSFDSIMESFEWYKKHFPASAAATKSTISHENIQYIDTVTKFFWEELGVNYISMNCVFENVWWKGDQLRLFDKICDVADYLLIDERWKRMGIRWFSPMFGQKDVSDTKWCGAGTCMDACGWDGTLYPCLRFKSLDNYPAYSCGHGKNFIPERITMLDVDNCHSEPDLQKNVTGVDCASCPISAGCASCQAYSYDVYGRADVKAIFICPMHKANVFANLYFMGNLIGWLKPQDRDWLLMLLDDYTANDYFGFDENGVPIPFDYPHLKQQQQNGG